MRDRITYNNLGKLGQLKWRIFAHYYTFQKKKSRTILPDYDIGVTTYITRFDSYFKSLFRQLLYLFKDRRIIIVANGHYERIMQTEYLKNLGLLLGEYPNVTLISYQNPFGLSKMWNDAIKSSRSGRILMLNDDIYLWPQFRREIESSGLLNRKVVKINDSWSHFLITQEIIDAVGWFDEKFIEIGHEDADYEARLACRNISIENVEIRSVFNCIDDIEEYSYGKRLEEVDGKYSGKNRQYFYSKWDTSDILKPGYTFLPIIGKWIKLKQYR